MMRFNLKQLIDEHRIQTGERLSYEDIANRAGTSKTTVYHIANNLRSNVDLRVLSGICGVFDCTPNDVIISNGGISDV